MKFSELITERLQSANMLDELNSFFNDWVGEWNIYTTYDKGGVFTDKISLEVNDNAKNIKFQLNAIKNIAKKYNYKVAVNKVVPTILHLDLSTIKKFYGNDEDLLRIEIHTNE